MLDDLPHLLRRCGSNLSTYVSAWFLLDSHWHAMSNIYGFRRRFWKRIAWHYCCWFLSNTESILEPSSIENSSKASEAHRKFQKTRRFVSWNRWPSSEVPLTQEKFDEEKFDYLGRSHFGPPRKEFRWSAKWDTESLTPPKRMLALLQDYNVSFFSAIPIFLWSLSYGITGAVISRVLKPSIEGSENEIDFG